MLVPVSDVLFPLLLLSQCVFWRGRTRSLQEKRIFLCLLVCGVFFHVVLFQYWQQSVWTVHSVQRNGVVEKEISKKDSGFELLRRHLNAGFEVENVAMSILDKTKEHLDKDSASLLIALLTGQKQFLSAALKDIIRRSGSSHLLALSGFHLNIVLFLFLKLRGRVFASFLYFAGLVTVWFYCIWVGFIPSLYRAAFLYSIAGCCRLFWAELKFLSLWSFTTMFFCILIPDIVLELGFMLSQLALLGVVYGRQLFPRFLEKYIPPGFIVLVSAGIGALATTAWYSFIFFGQVYPVSILASIVLSPIVILFVCLGLLFLLLPSALASFVGIALRFLGEFIRTVMSYASESLALDTLPKLLVLYAILIAMGIGSYIVTHRSAQAR